MGSSGLYAAFWHLTTTHKSVEGCWCHIFACVALAQAVFLWEFDLVLSKAQTGSVPWCHFFPVRTVHLNGHWKRRLLQQKGKTRKNAVTCVTPTVFSNVSLAQNLLVMFGLIQAISLFRRYLAGAIALDLATAGVTWHSAHICDRCICHRWLASFPKISHKYKWHWRHS